MTFFSEPTPAERERLEATSRELAARRERTRLRAVGEGSARGRRVLLAGMVLTALLAFCPAPYVIRQPGPVFDALGEATTDADAGPEEVIQITGAQTHEPESGHLDVLTVNVAGSPQYEPSWLEALIAWASPERDVLPIEQYYRDGETAEERDAATQQQMADSQDVARAAALRHLGYDVPAGIVVARLVDPSPAEGILQPGDIIRSVDGTPIESVQALREATSSNGLAPIVLGIERGGEASEVSVTPELRSLGDGPEQPAIGIQAGEQSFEFPVDIRISLGNVGGPSAGLMLSLAIVDKLEPGDLAGGRNIAGTGTIDSAGNVGPIGGIRQKLLAAIQAGADTFLAPSQNCAEAVGPGAPRDIPVYAVDTLDDAEHVVETVAAGADASGLRTCAAVAAAAADAR